MRNRTMSQNDLRHILSYDAEMGEFAWLVRRGRAHIGHIAGNVDSHGYRRITIDGARYRAHQLAWLYVYGEWPSSELDHCNRDKSDNRIANLRLSTRVQNAANRGVRSDSSVGLKGVTRLKSGYRAEIRHNGRSRHIGVFTTAEEAHSSYMEASRKLHGEFASC